MTKVKVITSLEASEKVVKELLCLDVGVVGVNCKGSDVGPKGRITQVTVSTCDDDVYIFDVRRQPKIILDGAVIRLFQSRELVKVFHNCSADCSALKKLYGVDVNNYFDTQVAFSTILEQSGFPPRKVSLSHLCERFVIDRYEPDRTQQMKMTDVNFWALRPITREMIDISAADVLPLVQIYFNLQHTIPAALAYGVYISQEIRYSRAYGSDGYMSATMNDLSTDMISWFEAKCIDNKFNKKRNTKEKCKRLKKITKQ